MRPGHESVRFALGGETERRSAAKPRSSKIFAARDDVERLHCRVWCQKLRTRRGSFGARTFLSAATRHFSSDREFQSLRPIESCRGQECPRAVLVAVPPRCASAFVSSGSSARSRL